MSYESIKNNINNCNVGVVTYNSDKVLLEEESNLGIVEDEMIEINGVSSREKIEKLLTIDGENTWAQVFIQGNLYITEKRPDIERVLSVTCNVKIISQRVIKTPILKRAAYGSTIDVPIKNSEEAMITGRKLVIEGVLKQKIVYVSSLNTKSLHATSFDTLFSTAIVLPVNTLLTTKYKINAYIEDIYINKNSSRNILNNVCLFLKTSPLVF